MIGDSANDLIAIKEANIGIGITETDSIYISNFGVRSLVSIIKIIKEGKSLMSINMEIIQYYLVSNLMIIAANLIIANDASNFGSL
jgi:P-type E1-E2 ATPase